MIETLNDYTYHIQVYSTLPHRHYHQLLMSWSGCLANIQRSVYDFLRLFSLFFIFVDFSHRCLRRTFAA